MKRRDYITLPLAAICLYLLVAGTYYRFRHPEATETQLFLRMPRWALWQE